ncbi:hypothetical protein [Amycolatopsis sp. PS_44_ISF1]|uniref:hypothetical protein n=1 Tax=Amycolatopsis sp. PS_44_ISF1 TaxID=2974917 RepID=UPI0028DF4189|nr:hypothetical protein [Amycolatopsis sp. PS_44_ISF1]MDT8913668.1 hypothetical protein [Amycolatopsis sp. PS_44_ISF1]
MHRTARRSVAGLSALALAAAAGMWVSPASAAPMAHPALSLLSCTTHGTVTFHPSITVGSQLINFTYTATSFTGCTGTTALRPISVTATGTEHAQCTGATTDHTATGHFKWSDGTTSTAAGGETAETKTGGSGTEDLPGTITSGTFAGHMTGFVGTTTDATTCSAATPEPNATVDALLTII